MVAFATCSSNEHSEIGDPSEIANAVVFLASDESAFTVGSGLIIDGGLSI